MKHYYNDNGILQFNSNNDLLAELVDAIDPEYDSNSKEDRRKFRLGIVETAVEVMHDYDIRGSMGGLGGCPKLAEWRNEQDVDPIRNVLKKMLFDAVDRGFMHNEFLLIAWDAACNVQFHFLLTPTKEI